MASAEFASRLALEAETDEQHCMTDTITNLTPTSQCSSLPALPRTSSSGSTKVMRRHHRPRRHHHSHSSSTGRITHHRGQLRSHLPLSSFFAPKLRRRRERQLRIQPSLAEHPGGECLGRRLWGGGRGARLRGGSGASVGGVGEGGRIEHVRRRKVKGLGRVVAFGGHRGSGGDGCARLVLNKNEGMSARFSWSMPPSIELTLRELFF